MSKKKKIEKLNPYSVDKFATIPAKTKIMFLKFWLSGAVFYFTINGLPVRFDLLDRLFVLYMAWVLGNEYIHNQIILWMNRDDQPTMKYLPHRIEKTSIYSLFATAFYTLIMLVSIQLFLEGWVRIGLPTFGNILWGASADPVSFALVYLLFDALWRKYISHRLKRGMET
jgi:hypothetical protein